MTGKWSEPRSKVESNLAANGFVVAKGLSSKVALLICGENAGESKCQKARSLGCGVCVESELNAYLAGDITWDELKCGVSDAGNNAMAESAAQKAILEASKGGFKTLKAKREAEKAEEPPAKKKVASPKKTASKKAAAKQTPSKKAAAKKTSSGGKAKKKKAVARN